MRKSKTLQKIPYLAPDVEAKVIPSPTDGWDQISPLAEMDPKRAPILTNWVPRPGYVEARQGFYTWTNTSDEPVETIMVYRPPSGGQTMFAASGGGIYDVSDYASLPISPAGEITNPGSGGTNGTYTNIALTGGSGTGAVGTIVVSGGVATAVTPTGGLGYKPGDVLSTSSIPGLLGFTYTIADFGSARWQWVNFTSSASNPVVSVIQCVNGVDPLQQWNGTVWSEPAITGLSFGDTTSDFVNIYAQKQRLWYIVANSTRVYFLATDAIEGAVAGYQDLGTLFNRGGYLVAMADWTIDGGNGPQDYVAFISSQGQIALYAGDDPTNTNAWSLVGVFSIAPPISYRCTWQIGSDVGIITQQGVLPISQVLPFDPSADRSVAITARIQNAMAQAAQIGGTFFGWQLMVYPMQQLLIVNVPVEENASQMQFIMNTLTGAWCEFTGWNANCFEVYNNQLFFGDNNGNVCAAYSGLADGVHGVSLDMQCAFNWFDEPGKEKRMTMLQPLLTTQGNIELTLSVDTDFSTSNAVNQISLTGAGVTWDSAIWDVSVWPSGTTNYTSWLSVEAIGHAFAARMNFVLPPNNTNLPLSVFDTATFDSSVFDGAANGTAIVLQVNAFNAILETGGPI